MAKYDVRVRYAFESTYTVVAEDYDEARQMASKDCRLVLDGNIHTALDSEDVDWNLGVHPGAQILSVAQRNGKGASVSIDFSGRVEELRTDIIRAIRQLLQTHCVTEVWFPEDDGYDSVWVIWFSKNGNPYKYMVTELRVTENGLTVFTKEKGSDYKMKCHSPFELGTRNIGWLHEIYDVVWRQLEDKENVEPETEKS